jgi:hypothetical protein
MVNGFKPFEDSTQDLSYVFYTTRDLLLLVDGTFLQGIDWGSSLCVCVVGL